MTKYTSGPWTVGDDMLKGADGTHLFQLVEQPGLGADAESIIAMIENAPAMLKALKLMVEKFSPFDRTIGQDRAIAEAFSAIAKAEGRS